MSKTQTTKKGVEIPTPKRSDFFSDLKKVTTPDKLKDRPKEK